MVCSKCGCGDLRSVSAWPIKGGVRRKRVCRNCGKTILTTERTEPEKKVANISNKSENLTNAEKSVNNEVQAKRPNVKKVGKFNWEDWRNERLNH